MHSIAEIRQGLDKAFEEIISFIENQSDDLFESSIADGKWSTGEQLEHLIKSVVPINLGLVLPKKILKWKYGTADREEMTFNELTSLYKQKLSEGGKATPPYVPKNIPLEKKSALLGKYRLEKEKLVKALTKWDEDTISEIVAPHPILGNLTIRELMFFTIYHNYHHLESIKSIQ
ncbi:MAG: DinB family protein [Cyanothece sp. SIO1E1]|nr:DinB family protein [Cyanothece sp. SIO1E1]